MSRTLCRSLLLALSLGGCAAQLASTPEEALTRERLTNVEITPVANEGCDGGFYEYSATERDGSDVCGTICCDAGECHVGFGSCGNPFSGIADGVGSVP